RKIFIEQNYKVFQVGTKDYSTLFELDNWPRFLFSQEISFPKKVFAFNRWIFERVKKLEPDIIILGIPGGIMPINNKICNYFGELALIISKALKIDVNIFVYFVKCFSQKSERNIPNFRNGIFPYISRKHFHMIMVQSVA
ncbi:MAG: TIGR04066 family peptide maturation system protein, partial [Blautia sp.]|nr:TIGR04066 family peptide maturation system protein [Blautia sp.]